MIPERAKRRQARGGLVLRLATAFTVAVVLLLGAGYYVIRTVMAPEWIRANVIPGLEAAYHRRVVFEDFRLRLRSIALTKVRVLEVDETTQDETAFLSVDRLVIGFDPLGLLRRAFLVEFVKLVRPDIRLRQEADGTWNTASLFRDEGPAPSSTLAASAPGFRFVITRLEVEDATVSCERATADPDATPATLRAEDLDASVMFHPMTGFLDYEARAVIELREREPASVVVFGALDLSGPRVDFEISVDGLDADALADFARARPGDAGPDALDDLLQTDVEHDLLVVATNSRLAGVPISRARLELSASRRELDLRTLEITALGGNLDATGRADFERAPSTVSLSASAKRIDLAALASTVGRQDLAKAVVGHMTGNVSVLAAGTTMDDMLESALGKTAIEGLPTGIGASLVLDLADVNLAALPARPPPASPAGRRAAFPLGTATIDVRAEAKRIRRDTVELDDARLDARLAAGQLRIRDFEATALGGTLKVAGDVDLTADAPRWAGRVSLQQARYEEMVPQTPRWAWADTNGRVDVELEVMGRGFGAAEITEALRRSEDVESRVASVEGRVAVDVDALDLDLLGKPPRVRDEYGPIDLGNVELDVDIKAERVRLWKLDYGDVRANGKFRHDRIAVEGISGHIAEGMLEVAGEADFRTKGFSYSGHGSFRDVETAVFAGTYLPPDVGRISGKGSASFEFALTGTKVQSTLDSLALEGYVALHSGRIEQSRLLEKIADTTGVKEFAKRELTRCGGDIQIANRRVSTKRLVVGGTDARVFMVGGLGFDKTLDAAVWLGFSPDIKRTIFSRGILLPYITDDNGWTYVPFTARGDLKDPQIETTPEAVRSTAIRALPDATERIVRESSRLLPGGETIVGGSIDAVKAILGGLGRVLQVNTARAKGEDPEPARPRTSKPSSPQAPINR